MNNHSYFTAKARRKAGQRNQRGIALVTTLLLLLLLMAMSLTMVLSVGSDMLVNGYYGNERGSFYAADSGANIARQAMAQGILNAVPATFAATTQPIPAGTNSTVQTSVAGAYATPTTINTSGSWPEKFMINGLTMGTPTCTVIGGPTTVAGAPISCTNLPAAGTSPAVTGFNYTFPYTLTSVGEAQGSEVATLVDSGNLVFNGTITPSGPSTMSFAAFGTFLDQYAACSAPFVAGTLTGPFFTNGTWNFGDANALGSSTKYDFVNSTGQVNAQTSWWHGGDCVNAAGSSNTADGTSIAPTFQSGFNQGQTAIALPANDFNQKQAVLDGIGQTSTAPTDAQMNAVLKNVSGTAYPTTGASSGVYLPYSVNATTGVKTFTGGGIYVEGDATVTLSPTGTGGEVYTIVQGGVTTTVTTNPSGSTAGAGTTTITQGSTTTTINGVPTLNNATTDTPTENATMLYVDGNITSLQGPAEYQPALNNGVALTITAADNVTVTGDIRYTTEPVTTSGSTPDTLIPANNTGQVLGIFTATGDIQMNNGNSDGNLEIDASIAMISQTSSGGWVNVGPHINTLNLVGGRIAMQAMSGNTTTRNIFFDQRFLSGGFAPPWYPSTTIQNNSTTDTSSFSPPTVQRLQWYYQSSYQ
jgi:Tfp pilus assembly protein PilX